MLRPYFSRPLVRSPAKTDRSADANLLRNVTIKRPHRETGKRVRVNVSGQLFETYMKTLLSKQGSIFKMDTIANHYDSTNEEFYFDRDCKSFKAILVYMQCGVMSKPNDTSLKIFTEELNFFGFPQEAFKLQSADSNVFLTCKFEPLKQLGFRKYIWQLLGNHNVNVYSQLLSAFCTSVTILWISLICMTSVPSISGSSGPSASLRSPGGTNSTMKHLTRTYNKIQMYCVFWFTLEILVRLLFSPSKKKFLLDWLNIIDCMSLSPFYVATALNVGTGDVLIIKLVRLVGIARIIRAFRIYKNTKAVRVILLSATSSSNELMLVAFFISIQMVLFSSLIFHFEYNEMDVGKGFPSIPHVFWFCLVTITTVGYGDIVPSTIGGKLCTATLGVLSTLVLALPTSIIVNNFLIYYKAVMKSNKEGEEALEYIPNVNSDGDCGEDVPLITRKRSVTHIQYRTRVEQMSAVAGKSADENYHLCNFVI